MKNEESLRSVWDSLTHGTKPSVVSLGKKRWVTPFVQIFVLGPIWSYWQPWTPHVMDDNMWGWKVIRENQLICANQPMVIVTGFILVLSYVGEATMISFFPWIYNLVLKKQSGKPAQTHSTNLDHQPTLRQISTMKVLVKRLPSDGRPRPKPKGGVKLGVLRKAKWVDT